jgi:hypothetical protein
MVMVLNHDVCSRFLTKDFMDTDVLICGSKFSGFVVFLKSSMYSGSLMGVRIVGQTDLWWLVG